MHCVVRVEILLPSLTASGIRRLTQKAPFQGEKFDFSECISNQSHCIYGTLFREIRCCQRKAVKIEFGTDCRIHDQLYAIVSVNNSCNQQYLLDPSAVYTVQKRGQEFEFNINFEITENVSVLNQNSIWRMYYYQILIIILKLYYHIIPDIQHTIPTRKITVVFYIRL